MAPALLQNTPSHKTAMKATWMFRTLRAHTSKSFRFAVFLLALAFSAFAYSSTAQPNASTDNTISNLVDVLKDDAARADLIEQLEAIVREEPAAAESVRQGDNSSFGRRIATITQNLVQSTVQRTTEFMRLLTTSESAFSGLSGDELGVLWAALPDLFLVIVITVGIFLIFRLFAVPWFRRIGERAKTANLWERTLMFAGSNLTDAAIVIMAWAAGYAVTVFFIGEFGKINIQQSMYLNAFLAVEMFKVVIRVLVSPNASGLRPVPMSDYAARSLNKSLTIVVTILGYGQLLIVPIVNQNASITAGNGVSAVLAATVLVYLIYVVVRRRKRVADWLCSHLDPHPSDLSDTNSDAVPNTDERWQRRGGHGAAFSLAQRWHWFALAYLTGMFLLAMTQSTDRVFNVLVGSGKILAALIAASLLSRLLAGIVVKGISLPKDVNLKLPLLEPRVNGFAMKAFRFLRWTIMIFALFFILDIVGVIDLRSWLESQIGLKLTGIAATLAGILIVAFAIWLAITSWVDYRLNPDFGSVPTAREITLLSLLRNAATLTIIVLTLMFCLSEIGLNIGPLLASAGVLGLAIGFGAQKMVQDIITGIFIQLENSINVGDIITVGGITGGVEKLSVRSVSLRDAHGIFHIIPFSSVDMVSNFSRDYSYYVCDMGVAYREDIDDVKLAMQDSFDFLLKDPDQGKYVVGDFEWFGVEAFADSAVIVRVRVKTVPGQQFMVGRAYNGILKRIFDERGIEIPFPHQTIYLGEAKDGSTQSFKIRSDES